MRLLSSWPRDARRIAAAGAAAALMAVAAGALLELARFGRSDAAAFLRVKADVTGRLEAMLDELHLKAASIAADSARIAAAARGDETAAANLFDAIEGLHGRDDDRVAITVYGPASGAVAWSDGPAEDLPPDRIAGPESLFAARGILGLRLVYLTPVAAPDGARAGAVAAERIIVPALGGDAAAPTILESSLAPVHLRMRHEGAGESAGLNSFVLHGYTGEVVLQGVVNPADLAAARARFRRSVLAVAGLLLALTLALLTGPILDARQRVSTVGGSLLLTGAGAAAIAGARAGAGWSVPAFWKSGPAFDLFASGAMLLAIVAVAAPLAGQLPVALRRRALAGRARPGRALAIAAPMAAGLLAALAIRAYARLLSQLSRHHGLDLLDFSLYPIVPERIFLLLGLILIAAATMWAAVLALVASHAFARGAGMRWRTVWQMAGATIALWPGGYPAGAVVAAAAAAMAASLVASRARRYYAHASHATRLLLVWALLILPALALYPVSVHYAERRKRDLVEREYAPRTSGHTRALQDHLSASLQQIDAMPLLDALVAAGSTPGSQAAYFVWSRTPLGEQRLVSAVELYGPDGLLSSSFSLDLPEVDAVSQRAVSPSCTWEVFGEVSRFGSDERRMLHAERGLCDGQGRVQGTIVVHAKPDYQTLPFIRAADPYLEVLRGPGAAERPGVKGLHVVTYGWGLLPIVPPGTSAWQLSPRTFERLYRSRDPFWTTMTADNAPWRVYLTNDRAGIYALGYRASTPFDYLVHVAELATLAGVAWMVMLAGAAFYLPLARRRMNVGRVLLREIRTSFYRKLLLAFVAASIIPVIVLALVLRGYTAGLLREDVEAEASRTVAVAQRSIESYATDQGTGTVPITDNLMEQLEQILSHDINLFEGPNLLATSERGLFASGLLPTRTPAQMYRRIALERAPSFVGEERIGDFPYLLAATHAQTAGRDVILSVPLLTRRNEIEEEIEDLDRGIHLAAVLFILLGSAIGLYMAERIADPIRRLTRATRRIAAGDLDARIAIRTADELRRLVDDFNRMGEELKTQRDELTRTQRLSAWAEMARQVAHEIKNPLTPIQLSAEHLRRVHADRGEPMSPVLEQCVDAILSQVTLLRQISSEFSAFASSPTVRAADVDLVELVREVVAPYHAGLNDRVRITVDVETADAQVRADRTLLGRAITNLIENGLHATPDGGRVSVSVRREGADVVLTVTDTGVGMDAEALDRAFEPYFSTKATGTGLGLPIARRNVELNGGSVAVSSERGRGTTVTVRLPALSA